jgi:DNA-binding NarL/FixJ family response regulator
MGIAVEQLDRTMEAIQQVEQYLRDYRWMADRVAQIKEEEEVLKNKSREVWEQIISPCITKYGEESTLPKAIGVGDPTFREAKQFLRNWERMKRYEQKMKLIEGAVAELTDERERAVAEGLMDGEKLYMIAEQIGVSRQTIYDIKRSMIRSLVIKMYGEQLIRGT